MPIDLYHAPASPPARVVRLTAAAVGVDLNLKLVDVMGGEHLTPEFLKMNPQHTVPTLDDNGFYLSESRAIMGYLVEQYAKDDSLYPKDPKKRAIVNQRLYFDACSLYQGYSEVFYPAIFSGSGLSNLKWDKTEKALEILEKYLEGQNYVAGNKLTIADISLAVTVSNFDLCGPDCSQFKNVTRWLARMKAEIPKYEEINGEGLNIFKGFIDSLSNK